MKKLLGVLLAMTLSWPASATVLHNVEVKGEIQTIASDVHHNDRDAMAAADLYNSGTSNRVLAGLSADLVEDVTANILFQYADRWGSDGDNGRNLDGYWNQVRVVNANVALHNLLCAFDLTVGRQFYGDEDSAVMYIGPNHYNAERNGYVNSLDAAKLTYADDMKSVTLIAGRVNGALGGLWAHKADEKVGDVYGADVRLTPSNMVKLQGYIYDLRDAEITNADGVAVHYANAGLYGAKATLNPEAFTLAAEYARNYGGHDMKGYMVKADIAANIKAVTARGAFVYAKEGFLSWGNYTPGLLVGHRFDVFNYANDGVRLFNLGFDMKPADKWTVSLDGYSFQGRHGKHAATLEADLTVKYDHNEYVQLFAGAGYVKYGSEDRLASRLSRTHRDDRDNFKGQLGMLIKF